MEEKNFMIGSLAGIFSGFLEDHFKNSLTDTVEILSIHQKQKQELSNLLNQGSLNQIREQDLSIDYEEFENYVLVDLLKDIQAILFSSNPQEILQKKEEILQKCALRCSFATSESKQFLEHFICLSIESASTVYWNRLSEQQKYMIGQFYPRSEAISSSSKEILSDEVFHQRLCAACKEQLHTTQHSTLRLKELDPSLYPDILDEDNQIFGANFNQTALLQKIKSIEKNPDLPPEKQTILMVGDGGIGKTATVYGTCNQLLEEEQIAMVVPFRDLRKYNSIRAYIHQNIFRNIPGYYEKFEFIFSGLHPTFSKVYLFLDGFNELAENTRNTVIDEIGKMTFHASVQIIITSRRPLEAEDCLVLDVQRITMQRLTWEQVVNYLNSRNIPLPNEGLMSEVLGLPLMLRMFAQIQLQCKNTPGITVFPYLNWKENMELPSHILWNYIQCQIYYAYSVLSSTEETHPYNLCDVILTAEFIAPYLAAKMNSAGLYKQNTGIVKEWLKEGRDLLKEDFKSKSKYIKTRLKPVKEKEDISINPKQLKKNQIYFLMTTVLDLLIETDNEVMFVHQDFQDVLHLLYIENSIKYSQTQLFAGAFTAAKLPYDVLTLMSQSFSHTEVETLWKQLKESSSCSDKFAAFNGIELLKRCKNKDLSKVDFSGMDLREADLSKTVFSARTDQAVFRSTQIGIHTFSRPGHKAPVTGVSWSPNGGRCASVAYDNSLLIWNSETGACIDKFSGHTHYIRCVSWSADGGKIASGGDDKTLRIWDASANQKERQEPLIKTGHKGWIYCIDWSKTGHYLLSGDSEKEILLWSLHKTTQSPKRFLGHTGKILALAWNPQKESVFASGSEDQTIRIWEQHSEKNILLEGMNGTVRALAWSPNGCYLAAASKDKLYIWDIEKLLTQPSIIVWNWNPKETYCLKYLSGFSASLTAILWEKDFFVAAVDSKLYLWNGSPLNTENYSSLDGHQGIINALSWSEHEKALISGSDDSTIRSWKARNPFWKRTWSCSHIFEGNSVPVRCASWLWDSNTLAAGYDDNLIRIWDVKKGRCCHILEGHTNRIKCLAWSPDGAFLASGANDNRVILWNSATYEPEYEMQKHSGPVNCILWLDNHRIVSGADDNRICIWEFKENRYTWLDGHTDSVYSMKLNQEKTILVSGADDKTLRFWDLTRNSEIPEKRIPREGIISHKKAIRCVEWLHKTNQLLSGSNDCMIKRWDGTTGLPWNHNPSLKCHTDFVYCLSSSPDEAYFISGSTDKTLLVWLTSFGKPICHLKEHQMFVWDVSWSPDGTLIASVSSDGTICIYDASGLQENRETVEIPCIKKLVSLPGVNIINCDFTGAAFDTPGLKEKVFMSGGVGI